MPTYGYTCKECNYDFEVEQKFSDDALTECPLCLENSLEKILYCPMVFTKNEPQTLGHLAEKNSKAMGSQEILERTMRDREKREIALKLPKGASKPQLSGEAPWWRPGTTKPINIKEINDVGKYIATGEKT